MSGDHLIALHSLNRKRAAKQFTLVKNKKTGEAKIRNQSYANETDFRVESIPVACFADLATALDRLIGLVYAFVIRGMPAAGINRNRTPRWKRPHGGQLPTFEAAPHHWFL